MKQQSFADRLVVWLVGFYGISTLGWYAIIVGYLAPNPFLCK